MTAEPIKTEHKLIQLDVGAVLKSKGIRLSGFVIRWLERLICQERLNELLRVSYPKRGADFCHSTVEHLGINIEIIDRENMPDPTNRRVIFVSNHPLGGLDGMLLIDFIRNHYGCEPRFVVNDLLMAVEPLTDVFLPINKLGRQSRESASAIDQAMESDIPIIIFPAGLCSRRRNGKIADLEWKKMFIQKARDFSRDIVPLRFEGQNSNKFYRIARLRELLGIKFNIEMALLPSEIFKAKGKTFKIICGKSIAVANLSSSLKDEVARIRSIVDNLKSTNE